MLHKLCDFKLKLLLQLCLSICCLYFTVFLNDMICRGIHYPCILVDNYKEIVHHRLLISKRNT